MSGIAVTQLPGFVQSGDLDLESRRLKTLLSMAREEAQSQVIEFGFKAIDEGYAFYRYDEVAQSWIQYEESPFYPRTLPEYIDFELKISGDKLSLSEEEDTPALLLLSSGEVSPFSLRVFQEDGLERTMESDGYSDIHWREDDSNE